MSIEVYGFESDTGVELSYRTLNITEARRFAQNCKLRLIAYTFEYADSELVEDYTGVNKKEGDEDAIQDS